MIARGFTLIEMMVVVVIMGLSASMVIMALPLQVSESSSNRAVEQLGAVITVLQEKSINEGRLFGLFFSDHDYQIMTLTHPEVSQGSDDVTGGTRELPKPVWKRYSIKDGGLSHDEPSEGELGPAGRFELRLSGLSLAETTDESTQARNEDTRQTPQILFLPGGEVTPFTLTIHLSTETPPKQDEIDVSETGQIHIETKSEDSR